MRSQSEAQRHHRLCELNVIEQVVNVSQTTVVRDAWARGQALTVHGWVYDFRDGLLRDLDMTVTAETDLASRAVNAHRLRLDASSMLDEELAQHRSMTVRLVVAIAADREIRVARQRCKQRDEALIVARGHLRAVFADEGLPRLR